MTSIRIPHLMDNYFEVCSAISAIISIQNVIKEKHGSIVNDIVKDEVYDDDPEINQSIKTQMLSHTEDSVTRMSSYAYILLVCSGVEKAMRLLHSDGLERKTKNEGYGDYFKRVGIVKGMTDDLVHILNDIFILRHWISHRNGRIQIQSTSEEEKGVLSRAGNNIEMDNRYIIVKHEYVDSMAKSIDIFLKQVAKAKYE